MKNEQGGIKLNWMEQFSAFRFFAVLFLFILQVTSVHAAGQSLKGLDFSALSGDKLQIQLEMSGPAQQPKVFQTDNPARIALDFDNVKSLLKEKKHVINIGAARSLYVVEASGRLRVVINLLELVPHDVKVKGNIVYVTMDSAKKEVKVSKKKISKKTKSNLSALLPKQVIKKLDFRRGPKGEGRLLISLSNPDTVVNAKEKGGKVVLSFLNTKLMGELAKKMDVTDFATPVQYIEAAAIGSKVRITVTPVDGNYGYSSFQTEGLLTIEFRPLTAAEKERARKDKFPYIGERLSLNFQDIEVRSVLQILADFTELNIIAADSVGGTVTLRLNDVPWDQALELILKSKGLAKRQTGNVMLVAPTAEINRIEKEEVDALKIVEQLEPLRTEYIQINYAKAENFRNLLFGNSSGGSDGCSVVSGGSGGSGGGGSGSNSRRGGQGQGSDDDQYMLVSNRGTAIVDSRTNILIVKDTAKQLNEVRKLIQLLDKPVRQVLIESRIVAARDNFVRELGVKFGVAKANSLDSGKEFGFFGAGVETSSVSEVISDVGAALGAATGGSLAITLARGADYILNLEIKALQNEEKGEIISNPRVMTSDRCQANIKQGVQIPYVTVSQDGTQTELVDAVLELNVTPQITPSGSVIMDLNVKKDSPGTFSNQGAVAIDTREVKTNVHVQDGETVVLGGVYEGEYTKALDKVPWFADLPAIGWMFRQTTTKNDKRELLIFITPKIIKDSLSIQ